jgi:hypothetical protein
VTLPLLAVRLRSALARQRLLREVQGSADVTFVRLRGNIGDHLIWAGARQLLRKVRHREVAAEALGDASGDLALMSGSGGWCEPFHGLAPQTLVELEKRFRRVVVLPSTFDPSYAPVAEILRGSRARIYARERVSFDKIRHLCDAGLAFDCAFYFHFGPFRRRGSGRLVAFRTDAESAIPWGAKGGLPAENVDISVTAPSLEQWLSTIAGCAEVETDRAHVMIAAALLGKRVRYATTTYHKVPAIAAYSLRGLPVELVRSRDYPAKVDRAPLIGPSQPLPAPTAPAARTLPASSRPDCPGCAGDEAHDVVPVEHALSFEAIANCRVDRVAVAWRGRPPERGAARMWPCTRSTPHRCAGDCRSAGRRCRW